MKSVIIPLMARAARFAPLRRIEASARRVKKKLDEYLARKSLTNPFELIKRVLVLIGKPFYLLFTLLIIVFAFVFYHFKLLKKVNIRPILRKIKFPTPEAKAFFGIIKLKFLLFFTVIAGRASKIKEIEIKSKPVKFLIFFLAFCFILWFFVVKDLPQPKDLVNRNIEVSTKIYDRNGILLYKIYKNKNRSLVPLSKIPEHVRLATLAAEDAEFYEHPGFSIRGILRAFIRNATRGELSGGSTITQQLVKNALLSPEKTLGRKIKEMVLAVEVEFTYSKDQIFEMYLNEVSYGGTAYGIQEATQLYFGKDVSALTLSEAALLAGLPKSPTKYSPFGTNPDLAKERQKEVLHLMVVNKFIKKEESEKVLQEPLIFAPNKINIKAPHFVMYVRQQLVEKYGEEVVEKGGLDVVTALDYSIQQMAEGVVKEEIEKLGRLNVGNGGALVLDPKTGEILAMVGSKDYFDQKNDGNVNVTAALRQPGSSIKIVNYAYALSHGYSPSSILDDSPVNFATPGLPPYSPRNYDGNYRGKITLRSALAESRNIPAVKVLASYGVSKMIEQGKKMGITSWNDPSRYGLSLTLGGGGVRLIDLAKVFATIANYGKRPDLISVLRVTNYKGKVLEDNNCANEISNRSTEALTVHAAEAAIDSCAKEQVVDPRVAFQIIDILKDNNARAPSFGSNSQLVIPGHPEVAVKTGTSNDLRDNLTIGFNQNYLVAVWVGNNNNSPMSRIASGITGAAPIWNKIISALLTNESTQDWQPPQGISRVGICTYTGTLPCEGCPIKYEWFLDEIKPKTACRVEQIAEIKEKQAQLEAAKKEGLPAQTGQILEPAAHFP